MACNLCGDICTCSPRPVSRAAVAEDPHQLWPATDAAWRDSAWRKEITSRVKAHKRRRGEDDSTMTLGFEEPDTPVEPLEEPEYEPELPPPPSRYQRIALKRAEAQMESGNLIMFPPPEPVIERLADPVVDPVQEALAEPLPDTPRILEQAHEAPTLFSDIHLDRAEAHIADDIQDDLGIELPIQAAPLSAQVLCLCTDTAFAAAAFLLFATVVHLMTGLSATGKQGIIVALGFVGLFWAAYHFVLLAYAGNTPGMSATGLGLCTFDDMVPGRRKRIVRSLALVLSVMSMGMGFVWSALDEDRLGWHDRISRTYLRPL
jgi:uncharacterized RDD family membrane protein YckC